MAVPLRGWGCKGPAIKKKNFLKTFYFLIKKVPTAIKLEGMGKALMARPLKKMLLLLPGPSFNFISNCSVELCFLHRIT